MPCGQLDRRRVGHRCAPCRKSHIKCDGGRPCPSCIARGVECVAARASSTFRFVQQREPSRVPRVLVQDSWRYISTYFQAVGSLTQASVLRHAAVTSMSHEDENVSRTLSIMGALYACRNPNVLRINAQERRHVMETWTGQKSVIVRELKKPETTKFTPVLLSALLLAVIELMVIQEEGIFEKWMSRVSGFLIAYGKTRPVAMWTPFEKDLVRFFHFLDTMSSIARQTPPHDLQVTCMLEPRPPPPITLEPAPGANPSLDTKKMDGMLSTMWRWAKLLPRMSIWASKVNEQYPLTRDGGEVSKESIHLRVQGLDIVCEASTLQSDIIANLLQLSQEQGPASVSLSPYYHWALTGLSHRLQEDVWKSLGCDLPVMPAETLHQQALLALGCVETLAGQVGLDAALYLPFADFVGCEMETVAEQERILKFLDLVKARGFDVADEFKMHLYEKWQAGEQRAAEQLVGQGEMLWPDQVYNEVMN